MHPRIAEDLARTFGLSVDDCREVSGGWLNRKWRILSGGEGYLVKQYSLERFTPQKLHRIADALLRQRVLWEKGVRCPRVLTVGGDVLRWVDDETVYMVMTFLPGWEETPQTVTPAQLFSLGRETARMHRAFGEICEADLPRLTERNVRDALAAHLAQARRQDMPERCRQALDRAERILSQDFPAVSGALAHEDYSRDNMLFQTDGLSAILDFDRNCVSFPLHDVGRILLSLCLRPDGMNRDGLRAFMEGYGRLTRREVGQSLRVAGWMEIPWWIHPKFFTENRPKPIRFRDEMLWLLEHWEELE